MNWQDDEFEGYLRQFQLRKPKPLPRRPRTPVLLAAAALVALALVVPMRMWSGGEAAPEVERANSESPAATGAPALPVTGLKPPASGVEPPTTGLKPPATRLEPPNLTSSKGSASAPTDSAKRRVRVGSVIRPPIRLFNVDPTYPQDAQAARIEGLVVLEIVIGVDGSVIQVEVVESIPELDRAAIDAASQWRYEPVLLNGEPVEVVMKVIINFKLS